MKVVSGLRARAQLCHVHVDRHRHAKQLQRLIQHVRAEVKPDTAARSFHFAPALAHFRAEAVKMRLQIAYLAQRALAEQRF